MTNIFDLPDDSLLRLKSIIGPGNPVPISRSTWFVWRKAGRAPAAVMLSPKIAAYRAGDVKALLRAENTFTSRYPRSHQSAGPQRVGPFFWNPEIRGIAK